MTRDNVTGLIWEMKTDDGTIHDKLNRYTWCDTNPATNGGNQGACGTRSGNPEDTEAFINAVNDAQFGGFSDWRLPTIKELSSLINSSVQSYGLAIDAAWFPLTTSSEYWSSTTNPQYTVLAWKVDFSDGGVVDSDVFSLGKKRALFVRAVRATTIASAALVDNGDGTVKDIGSGLMWQKATAPETYTWQNALSYCENLSLAGYSDWRLPNRNELQSLVDYSRYNPAIDPLLIPHTMPSYYWSSTTFVANNAWNAWFVHFGEGPIGPEDKLLQSYYVRAVRAGPWLGPRIQITPSSLNFGYVPSGSYKDLILQVKNIGIGTLTGTVSSSPPFSIVSGGNYSLGTDQSQVVTIRYKPTSQGPHTGTIVFTGGGGATVPVTGKTEKPKGLPWLLLLLGN